MNSISKYSQQTFIGHYFQKINHISRKSAICEQRNTNIFMSAMISDEEPMLETKE